MNQERIKTHTNKHSWGSLLWATIHSIALGFPHLPSNIERQQYQSFFETIYGIIPCPKCKEHYKEILKKIPIQLDNKLSLFEWTVKIHNEVNQSRTDIPTWTVNEALKQWGCIEYIFQQS